MALRSNPNQKYEDLKAAAAAARAPYEKDWWLNLAFYLDYQYVEWNGESTSLRQIPRRRDFPNAPRPVVNKIMHFVNQEHATVLQAKPTVDVLPATDDVLDSSHAQVALSYLRYLSEPQVGDFESTLSEATMWALVPGEGFIKWVYNPRLKRPDFFAVSPFDLYVDPYAKSFRNARYVIHSQFMDLEQIHDLYGVEVPESSEQKADPMKTALLRDMGQVPALKGAVVNELWMKPCRRYPEGVFVTWADRDVLSAPVPFPYKHGRLPFTQLGAIPRPGSYHFSSAVKYLRSPQMELNKYHAQRIMIRESFANPKWWLASELELEVDPDDSPNQILRGSGAAGMKPEIIQPSAFPPNDDGAWITEEMMHVVGLHEVSQAQVPGRVEAAKAIEMLKEADAGRQSELLRTIRNSISEGYWQALMLAKQYVSVDQMVATYSREGVPEVQRFKAEKTNPATRVLVTHGTGLARSRAARQDQLMLMWQNGVIRDPQLMAELMEIPVPSFVSSKAIDMRLARNENNDLQKGIAIVPNSWDDHEIHLREHNNFRKTQEFLTLPTETKQKWEHHCSTHEELQLKEMEKLVMKQQLVEQLAGGQPSGGPAPPSEEPQPQEPPGQSDSPTPS